MHQLLHGNNSFYCSYFSTQMPHEWLHRQRTITAHRVSIVIQCRTIYNVLLSPLCSPSALTVNSINIMFCFKRCCENGFMQKHVCLTKPAFVSHFWQSASAFLGTRAAELLINTDQNPQRGGDGTQTLDCIRLPRARSHRCRLHSIQPQLCVCYCSWGYECGGVSMRELCLCLCLYQLWYRCSVSWICVKM